MRRLLLGLAVVVAGVIAFVLLRPGLVGRTSGGGGGGGGGAQRRVEPVAGPLGWLVDAQRPRRRVAGRVLDEGEARPGARVRLLGERSRAGAVAVPTVTSGDGGRFLFEDVPAAVYVVVADAPGRSGDAEPIDLRQPGGTPPPERLELHLHGCAASLFGLVRDTSGGVIAGAVVGVREGPATSSDDQGAYELCLEPGASTVAAAADGYGGVSVEVDVYGRRHQDISLVPEATITGTVVRADGEPLADVLVAAVSASRDRFADSLPRSTVSAADGSFRLDGLAAGRFAVSARSEGYASADPVEVVVEGGATADAGALILDAAHALRGHVVAAGRAVAGARIDGSGLRGDPVEAVTDADGAFTLAGLLPGEIELGVNDYDVERPRTVRLGEGDVADVTVEVSARSSVSGRITCRGAPVDGATVLARDPRRQRLHAEARSGADGAYELRGLPEGELGIYAENLRLGAFADDVPVRVDRGERRTGVDIDLGLAGSIAGVVVDEAGAPVANAHVAFSLVDGRDYGNATTAADGSFKAVGLSGGGVYAVEVRSSRRGALLPSVDGGALPEVPVRDGLTDVRDVRLAVRVGRLEIAGVVVGAAGTPLPDVRVIAAEAADDGEPDFGTWNDLPTATTDIDGAFVLGGLLPGGYDLRASAPGGAVSELAAVAAGRRDVRLVLEDTAGIDGTLVGFGARPQVTASPAESGRWQEYRALVAGDGFSLRGLPAGSYVVEARAGSAAARAEVTLAPGEVGRVTLTAGGAATLDVTVTDLASGAPVPDLRCSCTPAGLHAEERLSLDESGRAVTPVPAGKAFLVCFGTGERRIFERRELWLAAGETARVRVRVVVEAADRPHGRLGIFLDPSAATLSIVVLGNGPAQRAGLRNGDVLVSVDGVTFEDVSAMGIWRFLAACTPGQARAVVVEREGERLAVTVVAEAAGYD